MMLKFVFRLSLLPTPTAKCRVDRMSQAPRQRMLQHFKRSLNLFTTDFTSSCSYNCNFTSSRGAVIASVYVKINLRRKDIYK